MLSVNREETLNCVYSRKLLRKLELVNASLLEIEDELINIEEVKKGICYAKYYHADQMRESGEPYYSHPIEVAYMVADYLPRTDIIIASILHDTLEDTKLTKEEIMKVFGVKIAEQVYNLTRIKEDGVKISSARMVEELWLHQKYDLLIVKLLDRLHNMQTINSKIDSKIQKNIDESLKSFLTFAELLEMSKISDNIASLCYEANQKLHPTEILECSFDKVLSLDLAFKSLKIFKTEEES